MKATVAALLAIAIFPSPARADLRAKLKAGEVVAVSIPSEGVSPGRAMAVVEAPADSVYRALADFSRYKEFVPRVTNSHHVQGNQYMIYARFPWPVKDTRVKVDVRSGKHEKTYVVKWRMLEGTLKNYEGTAWIQPWGKGRCLLTYQMLAVPQIFAPNVLMSYGLRRAANKMVQAVRRRMAEPAAIRTASR